LLSSQKTDLKSAFIINILNKKKNLKHILKGHFIFDFDSAFELCSLKKGHLVTILWQGKGGEGEGREAVGRRHTISLYWKRGFSSCLSTPQLCAPPCPSIQCHENICFGAV
jgi:hypothetical protein